MDLLMQQRQEKIKEILTKDYTKMCDEDRVEYFMAVEFATLDQELFGELKWQIGDCIRGVMEVVYVNTDSSVYRELIIIHMLKSNTYYSTEYQHTATGFESSSQEVFPVVKGCYIGWEWK